MNIYKQVTLIFLGFSAIISTLSWAGGYKMTIFSPEFQSYFKNASDKIINDLQQDVFQKTGRVVTHYYDYSIPYKEAEAANNYFDNKPIKIVEKSYWPGGSAENIIEMGPALEAYFDKNYKRAVHENAKLGVWYDLELPKGGLYAFRDKNNERVRYTYHVPAHAVAEGLFGLGEWIAYIIKLDKPLPAQDWDKNQLQN